MSQTRYIIDKAIKPHTKEEKILIAKVVQKPIPKIPEKKPEDIFESIVPGLLKSMRDELVIRNYSRQTLKNYSAIVKKYLLWLRQPPSEKDAERIRNYQLVLITDGKRAHRTINLVSAALMFFYSEVMRLNISIGSIPRMKTGRDLPTVYSQAEIGKILEAAQNVKHKLLLMLGYGCGLRLSEIVNLQPADFDWYRGLIRIHGKGSKERDVPLDQCLVGPLKKHLNENPGLKYVFEGTEKGCHYPARTIQKIYDNACKKSKIRRQGGIHSLRHSFATHLLEQGVDLARFRSCLVIQALKPHKFIPMLAGKKSERFVAL